jgi:hypothetical protein
MDQSDTLKTQFLPCSYIDRGRLESLLQVLHPGRCTVERKLDVWMINVPQKLSRVSICISCGTETANRN